MCAPHGVERDSQERVTSVRWGPVDRLPPWSMSTQVGGAMVVGKPRSARVAVQYSEAYPPDLMWERAADKGGVP